MKRQANTYSIVSMVFGIITAVMTLQIMPTLVIMPMAVIIPFFLGGMSILFGCLSRGSRRTFSTKAIIGVRIAAITLFVYTAAVSFLAISHTTNLGVRRIINSYISDTLELSGVTDITIDEDDNLIEIYHKYYTTAE